MTGKRRSAAFGTPVPASRHEPQYGAAEALHNGTLIHSARTRLNLAEMMMRE